LDTKWKNRIGIIAWLVLFAYGLSGVLTALVNDNDYVENDYFKTSQFQNTIGNLTEYIQAFEVSPSKEEMKKAITVSKDEIAEHRLNYGEYGDLGDQVLSIEQEFQPRIENAQANKDQKMADVYIKERDKKIEEVTTIFENDEFIEEKIKKEKENNIDNYFNELDQYRDDYEIYRQAFVYYLKNTATGEVYTNLPITNSKLVDQYINDKTMDFIQSYPSKNNGYLKMKENHLVWRYEDGVHFSTVNSNDQYEGKIGVSKDAPNTNMIMLDYDSYDRERIVYWIYTVGAVLALLASIIVGKKKGLFTSIASSKWQEKYNRIPFDLAIVLLGISIIASIVISVESSHIYMNFHVDDILIYLFWITVFIGLSTVQVNYMYKRLTSHPNQKGIWKNTYIARVLNIFRDAFLNRKVGTQIFLILTVVFSLGLLLGLGGVDEGFLIIFMFAFFIIGVPLFIIIIRRTGSFNKILINAKALANGKFEPDLEIKGKSVIAKLAEDINKMKYGVETSQTAQAKSERLKTELITNVSHDLRTPLTSIITYTELLKNPEIAEEERSTYIEIIDRKSQRLKVLIEDLFEASKMASGSIELAKQKVDIVQLLQQALAEYNETIQASQVQFRVSNPEHPLYAFVDGQKMWRVFENLIGNMINYSLENTRAFISVKEENDQVIITFKNISKYELSENTDELFERFKRGDESRHTDGSGLGLAIAKSIVDLHGGALDLEVDGDLFKVTVILERLGK
jgi:signal transduction histidine kinase